MAASVITGKIQDIAAAALLMFALNAGAATSVITGKVQDILAGTSARAIVFESMTDPSVESGGTVTLNSQKTVTCGTDGTFSVTLHSGGYRVTVSDAWQRSVWKIQVPTNGLPYDISAVWISGTPTNAASYYSSAAVDGLLSGYVTGINGRVRGNATGSQPGLSISDGGGWLYRGLIVTNSGIVATDTNGNPTAYMVGSGGSAQFAVGSTGAVTLDASGSTFANGDIAFLPSGGGMSFKTNSFITEPITSKQWNFKPAMDSNTVARISDLAISPTNLANRPLLVFTGDSLSTGDYVEDGIAYGVKLRGLTNYFFYRGYTNFASSGLTAQQLWADYLTGANFAPVRAGITNGDNLIMFEWSGINDARNLNSAVNIFSYKSNIWRSARGQGMRVAAITVIQPGDATSNATCYAIITNLNAMILSATNQWDHIIPAHTMFADINATRIGDKVHVNAAGNLTLATYINTNIFAGPTPKLSMIGGTHYDLLTLIATGYGRENSTTNPLLSIETANGTRFLRLTPEEIFSANNLNLRVAGNVGIGYDQVVYPPGEKFSMLGGWIMVENGSGVKLQNSGGFLAPHASGYISTTLSTNTGAFTNGGKADVTGAVNAYGGLSVNVAGGNGSFITNGTLIWYQTNNTPTLALPNGSLATITDGRFYVRANSTWVQK